MPKQIRFYFPRSLHSALTVARRLAFFMFFFSQTFCRLIRRFVSNLLHFSHLTFDFTSFCLFVNWKSFSLCNLRHKWQRHTRVDTDDVKWFSIFASFSVIFTKIHFRVSFHLLFFRSPSVVSMSKTKSILEYVYWFHRTFYVPFVSDHLKLFFSFEISFFNFCFAFCTMTLISLGLSLICSTFVIRFSCVKDKTTFLVINSMFFPGFYFFIFPSSVE